MLNGSQERSIVIFASDMIMSMLSIGVEFAGRKATMHIRSIIVAIVEILVIKPANITVSAVDNTDIISILIVENVVN